MSKRGSESDLEKSGLDTESGNVDETENLFRSDGVRPNGFGAYAPVNCNYVSVKGIGRYSNALKHLLPFRRKISKENVLKIDEAGFFSLITFSWMTKYIYRAYKRGLTLDDVPLGSPLDSCDLNAKRLESLWEREIAKFGPEKASFGRAVWKFVRTRVLIGCITFSISCVMGFLSPTIFMRKLIEYLEDPNDSQMSGFVWAVALTTSEILRTMFFALYYSLSYRTAVRLRSACLAMVYRKILRLNSNKNTSTGEIINLFSFDGPRLYYMIVFGPMAIGGPVISVFGFFYIYYILGAWALLGMLIFTSYYPLQYLLSHLTGYYRQKAVKQSDKRIKLITEILTSIKLIKMYAWENWFSTQIQDVRKKELREIEKIAYCQSVGISLAPTVPVISGIATFLIHVVLGGNLTAAQAFSVLVFLTKQMKTSIQVIRDGSLAFYEGIISVQRFKAFPVFSFASRQQRLTLTQLRLGSVSIVQGLTTIPRFKVYTVMVILHTQLRTALLNMRYGSDSFLQGRIICNRFQEFLMREENCTRFSRHVGDESVVLSMSHGYFTWGTSSSDGTRATSGTSGSAPTAESTTGSDKPTEVLFDINLTVRKGALIGVCGPVGSGKSSLLLAFLGQLKMTSGKISRVGTCAYVSQQSWMENTTLKENIIFGGKFDPKRYAQVLHTCVLNDDINYLPCGDETEVGERGVNLSGGQKQRVSLARALYSNRDIYFLDDPMSAVDPAVAGQIFDRYIMTALEGKTVVLVTRQVQFLRRCDEIIVMKEGRIAERGTYEELVNKDNEFGRVMLSGSLQQGFSDKICSGRSDSCPQKKDLGSGHPPDSPKSPGAKKLAQAEEQIRGTIKATAYKAYVTAAGGYVVCFFVTLVILLNVGSNVFSSWWLAMWIKAGSGGTFVTDPATNETVISDNINDNPDLPFYMQVYGSIIGLIVVTCVVRGYIYTKVTVRASRILHERLYLKTMNSPMSYFERTPIGLIQNLFSRDVDEIDSRLPESLETMLQNIWAVAFSFLSITLVFPWFIIPGILLSALYYFISRIFRVAIRDLKRMENISRAPVFSSVSATVQGLSLIHAFEKEYDYLKQFCKLFDENSTIFFLSNNAMRWMAVRLDFISVSISFITSFLVALLKGEVAPAYAGLALTYAAQICGVFQYTIRLLSENEARFISVERIQTTTDKLVSEGDAKCEGEVPENWPSKGSIEFHEVNLSYGEDLPNVLKDINLVISGGEKIGIVGRTGAGKSSLISALFRLVELSSGHIFIDGVNIARVPLPVLRSRLSVIPQDPVLFSESLRANLDPFNRYEDGALWDALKKTRLLTKVRSMPEQMQTLVGDGDGLSVGEKQLVCLARTILRGSKIVILDEATASIDPETELAVQKTIEEEFVGCTLIIIAHRLSTITNCDRIMVVDQGMVLEFESPKMLMDNPNSHFSKMLAASEAQL